MSSKQQEQGGAEGDAGAATATATASEPIPHEPAWRLLLGELWQAPEQQVVCRLLCCSRAMARLVHALCAGRVVVRISRQPEATTAPEWEQQVAALGKAYSTWLAKHARLLAELRLEVWDEQEQHVAAGLRAAAGLADSDVPRTSTAAVVDGAAASAAAAGNIDEQAGAAAQPQPLRRLALSTSDSRGWWRSNALGPPPSIRLLPSLAGACPRLTQLQLEGSVVADAQQLATAFAALRELRELSLDQDMLVPVPTLQLGRQLTKLRLFGVLLSAEGFNSLLPSLLDLHYHSSALPAAAHLTALTRLECYELDAGSRVPQSVQQLELAWCSNPALLHHLTRLRSLECEMSCSLEQLQAAVAAIGPSLMSLDMRACGGDLARAMLSQRVSGPSLPLTGLSVGGGQTSVAHLGQWTGLAVPRSWRCAVSRHQRRRRCWRSSCRC